jgi:uncharacterized protein YigE (DUF2233 family)
MRGRNALAAELKAKGSTLRFAIKGGMYGGDFRPVGLYIENGRELTSANTAILTGAPSQIPNFYKKPNGVFYIGQREAGVVETERFLREKEKPISPLSPVRCSSSRERSPAFIVNSTDCKPRDGAVSSANEVFFVITKSWVSFYEFAWFSVTVMPCFSMEARRLAPELGRDDAPGHGGYGPIIAVVEGAFGEK